jgi:UDP-glucose 4-epimerase
MFDTPTPMPNAYTTIIIGKRSNLTQALIKRIPEAIAIPSSDHDSLELAIQSNASIALIYNAFVKSSQLGNTASPVQYVDETLGRLAVFLDLCKKYKNKIKTVLYTSSSAIYGDNSECDEQSPAKPLSLYASMKCASEHLVQENLSKQGIRTVLPRIFNMYGGSDEFSIISKLLKALKEGTPVTLNNKGESIRDFIHIDDVATIYQALIASPHAGPINIGTGVGHSIQEIINHIEKLANAQFIKIEKTSNEIKKSQAKIDTLRRIIGNFEFKTIETEIEKMLNQSIPCK